MNPRELKATMAARNPFCRPAEAAFRRKYRMEGKEPFLRSRDQHLAEDMLQRRQKYIAPCPHGNWKTALPQGHHHGMTLEFSAGAHEFDETRKSGNIYQFRGRMTLPRASLPRTAHERRPRRKLSLLCSLRRRLQPMQQEIAEGCQSTFLHKDHSPPAKLVKSAPNDLNWGNP